MGKNFGLELGIQHEKKKLWGKARHHEKKINVKLGTILENTRKMINDQLISHRLHDIKLWRQVTFPGQAYIMSY